MNLPGLDFQPGQEPGALRDTVRVFPRARSPRAADIDRSALFPLSPWRKLGVLGLTEPRTAGRRESAWNGGRKEEYRALSKRRSVLGNGAEWEDGARGAEGTSGTRKPCAASPSGTPGMERHSS